MSDHASLWGRRPVESFRYPAVQPSGVISPGLLGLVVGDHKAREQALQQEIAAAVKAARQQGLQEGMAQANAAAAQALDEERLALGQALGDFAGQQSDYFRRVESEAVRLALSIARKILHREAQMDPLLLAGVIRVALDQMQAGSRLVLRTSPESASSWSEFCAKNLASDREVEVVPDSSLKNHQCVLQAEVGSTEVSLDAQLNEIESGFFDLLQEKVASEP